MATILSEYGVSEERGFVSDPDPLLRLPPYYKPWDDLADQVASLRNDSTTLRERVRQLPLLDHTHLNGPAELHRANAALVTIAHGYIWCAGDAGAPKSLPRVVAVPWVGVTDRLGLPPILTHNSTALHNWKRIDPTGPLELSNLQPIHSITGAEDEAWFFLVASQIELAGAPGVKAAVEAQAAASEDDLQKVVLSLKVVAESLRSAKRALERMYERCRPESFYNDLRPYLAGWKGTVYPEGLIYEGAFNDEPRQFSGGSAAQSALFPLFSEALGISYGEENDHDAFLGEMRDYMTRNQREFLIAVAEGTSVRDYVKSRGRDDLTRAYNDALDAFVEFRTCHVRIVTSYVVLPSRKASLTKGHESLVDVGTGGTTVMPFLKFTRDCVLEFKL